MSDISIPGVSDKYGTKKTIADLMKVEAIPKTRAEAELKKEESQKKIWQDVGVKMSRLRDSSRTLFSYNNPFSARVAKSSNEDALTATAARDAIESVKSIEIKQIAQADRFLSGNLPKDYKAPAGEYVFRLGDKKTVIQFSGGSLSDLADAINKRGKDIVKAQVISIEKSTQSILIEGQKTGKSNKLVFEGAAQDFALASGMLEKTLASERSVEPAGSQLRAWSKPIDPASVVSKEGSLTLKPGGEVGVAISPAAKASGNMTLEFQMKVTDLPEGVQPTAPSGPVIPKTGSIEYQGIRVDFADMAVPLPEWQPPPVPPRVDDLNIAHAGLSNGTTASLGPAQATGEFVTVKVRVADLGGDLSQLDFRNRNTNRQVEVRGIRVYDPDETGGFRAKNPVSNARDAVLSLDGVEVTREGNTVDDLVPGVTLSLLDKTEKPVRLSIEPDRKAVKDQLIAWVGYYNQLMTEANILTKSDDNVISELEYMSAEEKKTAEERLGILQGDFTLNQTRSSLQRVAMNAYPTQEGSKLSLLQQIGISTNARSVGSTAGYDKSRLRGYLEMDEAKLDEALKGKMAAIKQLFGSDSDNDLIVDSGLAYSMDALLKPYVETNGILAGKQQTISGQIDRTKKTISDLQTKLDAKEAELKRKYGQMEGALQQMDRTSKSIDNFSKNNQ